MSGKNRAFALAIATAALVGFAAPAASASSNPSGFNNDSIVNVSRNQVPIQACNNDVPVNAGFLVGQVPLADISGLLGLVNTGNNTVNDDRTCNLNPTQTDPSTTTTSSTSTDPSTAPTTNSTSSNSSNQTNSCSSCSTGSTDSDHGNANTSGFNDDSILNVSNNQVPIQACNNDVPVNAGVGAVQVVGEDLSALGGLLGNSGNSTVNDNRTCNMTPMQNNPTAVSATSSSS
jgi:hypothetical protein